MHKQELQHFTYQLTEVISGIYCELDNSTVEAGLRAQGITLLRVVQMHTKVTVNVERKKRPLPLVLVHIPRTER
jgi:hypothetical protein